MGDLGSARGGRVACGASGFPGKERIVQSRSAVPAGFAEISRRRIVDAGARIVVGHHRQTLQGVELDKGGVIVYSLGNFLFDSLTLPGDAAVLFWDVRKRRVLRVARRPPRLDDREALHVLPAADPRATPVTALLARLCRDLGTRTRVERGPGSLCPPPPERDQSPPISDRFLGSDQAVVVSGSRPVVFPHALPHSKCSYPIRRHRAQSPQHGQGWC